MKKIIRLTEGDLHRIIENAVRRIVKEYGKDAPVDQIVGADSWDDDDDEAMENNFEKSYIKWQKR